MEARTRELNALKQLEGVYTRTPIGLFSTSIDGTLYNANPAFRETFKLRDETLHAPRFALLWKRELKVVCNEVTANTPALGKELHITDELGEQRWYMVDIAANKSGYEGSISETTPRKAAELKLEFLATHDASSGSLNAQGFERVLAEYLNSDQPAVLGEIGFERYGYLQKIHGREIAEQAFCSLVAKTQERLQTAHIGRVHDSIFLLVPRVDLDTIEESLTDMFATLKQEGLTVGNIEIPATLSGGLYALDNDSSPSDALLHATLAHQMAKDSADKALVATQKNEGALVRELEATRLAGGLDAYIKAGRFFLVAQPIVDMTKTSSRPAFELLLRMKGENGEAISPWRFIPAAEELGLMSTLDRFVLREAFRLVQEGHLCLDQLKYVSINLSGSSLNDVDFLSDVYDLIASTRIDLKDFCFEITETVALNSFQSTKEFLSALQALGARTAIDDFGAGHSSIHYLSELSPNYLKIDGSLISKVLTHPIHKSFVQKMADLAREMNVECVAEFVESEEQERALLDMGLSTGQGYYYAAPMPVEDVASFCRTWAENSLGGDKEERPSNLPTSLSTPS